MGVFFLEVGFPFRCNYEHAVVPAWFSGRPVWSMAWPRCLINDPSGAYPLATKYIYKVTEQDYVSWT